MGTQIHTILPPDTPTVMDNYKEPLKAVEGGYGYMGTIVYNQERTHTQCHICGHFFSRLGSHLKDHDIKVKAYRERFSLPTNTPLAATKAVRPAWSRWQSMTSEEREAHMEKMRAGRQAALDNGADWRRRRGKTLYHKNLEGSCPDQLLDKIEVLAKKLRRTPSFRDFKREYGGKFVNAINGTYGSWGEALDILNMTPQKSGYSARYSEDSLLEMLVNFKEMNGREAMWSDFGRGILPGQTTYRRQFGSWTKAKEKAYGAR